ncbi:MAG TPA: repressor LexA [Flavobacteriaceae bacterium]|nr:repressor LexA [Flavobacteriaceae bacterium]HIP27312.1 repressor LexA [Flavobacteriaceae bacterium]
MNLSVMNRIKEVLTEKGIKQKWLSEKLDKSYNMLNSYVQNRRQPSLEILFKIAQILDVSVAELLEDNKQQSKVIVLNSSEETIDIPLLGNVACGLPIFADENVEAKIPISIKLIKKGFRYFLLRAKGDSMNDAGINDGDLVLIRQQNQANNGDNVVALINNEATIKEYQHKGKLIVLKPKSKSSKYQPIILSDDFLIQGIVESVIAI